MHALHGQARACPLDWGTIPAAVVCSTAGILSVALVYRANPEGSRRLLNE